jgi:hypothetical protein
MAWTIDDYNALKQSIAQGAKVVKYGDKTVEYRSLSEMLLIKGAMEQELGVISGKLHINTPTFNKGAYPSDGQ